MEKHPIRKIEHADRKILRLRVETVRGNLQGVKDALAQGVAVDQPFRTGEWNALMHASSLGHHHIVQYLLEAGADPNFHKELFTPLMAACASNTDNEEKLVHCVKHLLRHNANVNALERHRLTPLMFACKQGHVKIVQQLLANRVNLNAQDSQGWTALFWAVSKGKVEIVELLVSEGANKEERDRSGGTALLLATRKGYHEIEEILRFGIRRHITFDSKSDSSGCPTEDDNSNSFSNSIDRIDRNGDSHTEISNQLNKEISKYLSQHDDEFKKFGLKHSWPREEADLMKEFQFKEWKRSDEENLPISHIASMKLLAELVTQIRNIHSVMAFIRYKFQNFPLDQPENKKMVRSSRLKCLTRLAYWKAEQLYLETKFLHEFISKTEDAEVFPFKLDEPEDKASEELTKNFTDTIDPSSKSSLLTTIVVTAACIMVVVWNTKVIRSFTLFNF